MLIKKDINTLSAPNFFPTNTKRESDASHGNDKRKPILKKNAIQQNADQVQNHCDKQNLGQHPRVSMTQSEEIESKISYEKMRKIQKKKKSIFLELEELRNSSKNRKRSKSKKISFLSMSNSELDDTQIRQSKQNYKQSKIDILVSNSNISDSFWNGQTHQEIDFDLPQKSFKTLKSSQVVQLQPNQPTSIRLEFKKPHQYPAKKSDRIIQDSDTKREKRVEKPKTCDQTLSQKSNPLSTPSSNFFKKTVYYEIDSSCNEGKGTFFTIKQTPPSTEKLLGGWRQKKQKKYQQKGLERQEQEMKLRSTKQSSLKRKRTETQKDKSKLNGKNNFSEQTQNLLVTLNPVSSQVLPQLMSSGSIQLRGTFQDDFFETINSYRFLNRLCYKVKKYMDFHVNKHSYEELVAQMTKVKCFTLLNAQLELQTLHSFQNVSQNGIHQFLIIIQQYIEKQKKQTYWRNAENEFLRVTNSPFSLNDKIIAYLELTFPQFEKQLKSTLPELEKGLRTKESLSIQLRFKLFKHLLYDIVKMNLFEQRQLPVSLKARDHKNERLIELIEKDKWFEKVPFQEIPAQFQQLKKDFDYLSF